MHVELSPDGQDKKEERTLSNTKVVLWFCLALEEFRKTEEGHGTAPTSHAPFLEWRVNRQGEIK